MLVIRRRAGESVLIGDDVAIEVLAVESSQVKLGIRAPREILVLRHEVYVTRRANHEAAAADVSPERLAKLMERLRRSPNAHTPSARADKDL
jgi:carbon storage regulator